MPSSTFQGRRPFRAQLDFFRQKTSIPTRAWTDLIESEHDIGFMAAGASKAQLIEDLRGAIDRVIAEGRTLRDFRRDFDGIVARNGWAFNGGRNWRTRVIYETNLRQSYHAGREAQMADPALRQRRPFGLYRHGGSDEPRPEHLALDGTVLPLDHPFWDVWTPQNGWGCSCKKFMVSARDAERLGLPVLDQAPPGSLAQETVTVGARGPSPRQVRVPAGIDPGFAVRPGALHTSQGAMDIYQRMGSGLAPRAAATFHQAVRERALRQINKEWTGWLAAARAGSPQAARQPAAIGMLRPAEVNALDARGTSPARTDISLDARLVSANAGPTPDEWLNLPTLLDQRRAALLDPDTGRVILVAPGSGADRLAFTADLIGGSLTTTTLGRLPLATLRRFELLTGAL